MIVSEAGPVLHMVAPAPSGRSCGFPCLSLGLAATPGREGGSEGWIVGPSTPRQASLQPEGNQSRSERYTLCKVEESV